MTITREQVADLQAGDVVELGFPSGTVIRGPLAEDRHIGGLEIAEAGWNVRTSIGDPTHHMRDVGTLTVISRAKPPLYVNSDKTEPDPGDVVRQDSGPFSVYAHTWHYLGNEDDPGRWWRFDNTSVPFDENAALRLLVDGRTGQVVPS